MQRKVVRHPTFSPAFPRSCQNRVSGLHGMPEMRAVLSLDGQTWSNMVKHGQIMSKLAWGDRLTIDVEQLE